LLQVSLGTITNVDDAVKWLSYTYLFVRMRCNPLVYGLHYDALEKDPNLDTHRRDLVVIAGMSDFCIQEYVFFSTQLKVDCLRYVFVIVTHYYKPELVEKFPLAQSGRVLVCRPWG
jgi:replicative superfamily II helicase